MSATLMNAMQPMDCLSLCLLLVQVVVRRWDPTTEDLTEEGITAETLEGIRAGSVCVYACVWGGGGCMYMYLHSDTIL